jgi:hypothetical protein
MFNRGTWAAAVPWCQQQRLPALLGQVDASVRLLTYTDVRRQEDDFSIPEAEADRDGR